MMHKEQLQDLLIDKYLQEDIDLDECVHLFKKTELLYEGKVKMFAKAAGKGFAAGAAVGGIAIATLVKLVNRERRKIDEEYNKCIAECKKNSNWGNHPRDYTPCSRKCALESNNRLEKLKSKVKDLQKKELNKKH